MSPQRWAYSALDQRWHLLLGPQLWAAADEARCGYWLCADAVHAQAHGLKCRACVQVLQFVAPELRELYPGLSRSGSGRRLSQHPPLLRLPVVGRPNQPREEP